MGQTEIEVGRGVTEWTDRGREKRLKASWAFAISFIFYLGISKKRGEKKS